MNKIVFLGYVVDLMEIKNMTGVSIAGNKMQWNVIKHLSALGYNIDCVTVAPVAIFPNDKTVYHKKQVTQLLLKVKSTKIGFWNLPFIKQIHQISQVYREAKKILKLNPNATLLCYNLFPQIGVPMRRLKKKFPTCKTVCLLADLPIDDNTNRKGFSKFLRKKFDASTWKSISCCDNFIVLNEYVAKRYLEGKSYIVVDGGVAEDEIMPYRWIPNTKKNILFCGALTEYNGILNLLKAMDLLKNEEITLDIYGGGYLEQEVKYFADKHPNIIYHGKVSNKEVMQKQREAWLLINPRIKDDPIAQLTFPSKTFEYMLSGTPILSTRLNGYSEKYNDKMFFTEDTPSEIANSIQKIAQLSDTELQEISQRAYTFIVNERTWKKQTKKISEFLSSDI